MAKRINISSGTVWERKVGYSRAVRVGNIVDVAGTVAVDQEGGVVGPGDVYLQTQFVLSKIEDALAEAGANLSDVVRTRMFMTDISRWQEAGRAHGEVFGHIRPVATAVEISKLIDPELLIEVEVTAIIAHA